MLAAEILRTVFHGVILFLICGAGSGIVAALIYLKFVSRLPGERDRRMRLMDRKPGIDPVSGEAVDRPRRPSRSATSTPVRLR